jgi:hypothetical protein
MKIWEVLRGPYEDLLGMVYSICLVESDKGDMYEEEIYYDSMEDAMRMMAYFKSEIEPLVLEEFNVEDAPNNS